MDSNLPFGGKVVIFCGDFRQTLSVIERATKHVLIESSFPNSVLWSKLHKLKLTQNMRAMLDHAFSQFLLRIGEGREPVDANGEIALSPDIVISYYDKDQSLNRLVESVFPDLQLYSKDPYRMINRCILTPKNSSVDELNELLINKFHENVQIYISSDRTVEQQHQGDYEDFLNSQNPKGLPPHKLLLKENCPIMLLRNLNPNEGLCNGTRNYFWHSRWETVFIPKIPLQTSDNERNGIPFIRTQFPIRLCFALTINKLYVALSRARTAAHLKVLLIPGTFDEKKINCKTRNGSKVEAIIFNADIPKMSPLLHVYKKYKITNAEVKPIPAKFQTTELTI
ncbi:uncharacterized protein [Coffea arabica]|uniref:ATP-dependent DNA helicase n=1 Tax=Coffea arabica TaxID=13443 RepID=A0A6P6TFI7_COFAR|nr:uncharacterized protein LOC113700522 [Coffea arabica]